MALIINSVYERDDLFLAIFFCTMSLFITSQTIGHIIGICCPKNPIVLIVLSIVYMLLFGEYLIFSKQYPQLIHKLIGLNPLCWFVKYIYFKFYHDKCNYNQISFVFFKYEIVHDDFDKSWQIFLLQIFIYRIFTYITLKIKVNLIIVQHSFDRCFRKHI
jgi:hypothetical protein